MTSEQSFHRGRQCLALVAIAAQMLALGILYLAVGLFLAANKQSQKLVDNRNNK